ncbi:NAD+ synthase [Luteolibacter luteus]|uniref:Glutamine-dependent NAD(+) synthetase n=1 Tax=Luteolibacter luteus TaxID=2728835 RepID=A0A858RLZ3_9BACT|nr:NAD+ synthase [Luteolibacter luteus]QJE98396.1 NAD+ synthase [Luteolibacter luteus]
MKVGIAQINAVIGDFPGNAKRLLQAYRECLEAGADLVITPELSLVGYPPRDLVLRSGFVDKCLQALDYLAGEVKDVPLLVGYLDHHDSGKPGKPFRNAAAFLHHGEVAEKRWKTLLPAYDVFDERRYFEPGERCEPILWNGSRLGITICEDIWIEGYQERPLYDRDPVKELCDAGIDILLNLSASPFHLGKPGLRRGLMTDLAKKAGVPVVFANAAGAQDELVFDGHSLVASPDGKIVVQMKGFESACLTVDLDALPADEAPLEILGAEEQVFHALVLGLRDYAWKCGFRSACLGLSGGIDSALVAVIAAAALGPENVHGLTLPSGYSSPGSVTDSEALAENLGIRCDTIPIEGIFGAVKSAMAPLFLSLSPDVTEENMQARIRGLLLMALANKEGHLLLSTGNKSELAVGYCTIYGDMCGGLAVISDVPKTRVFDLCHWLNREREIIPRNIMEKPPSAELRPDQKDQDTLPPYPALDGILELYVERQLAAEEIVAQGYDEATVRWVQRRVDQNEWKRRQAAPGLRVTTKAFGTGRQMPLAQGYGI